MMQSPKISATGWIADNWPAFAHEDRPPVILNPEASPGAALAWCYGEIRSLYATSTAMGSSSADSVSCDDVMAIFAHRLGPLAKVMQAALNRMASSDPGDTR